MSATAQEISFAKAMSKLAGKEAKKRGLRPRQFNGAFVDDSFVFEITFETQLRAETPCQGKA